ncbi:nuclear GTP-binding protein [Phanerochaete sordida]|uniref:Nuclear GTP-binding protein n=1 Tax=Phanerochaete sordida TaxID=48140 RepID=A0A9P3FX82_9APHY|nr:nuclear GTP-binding protein [Phanerochaete sordida]
MPRIRKKTSKRGTTNQREKIKHKVRETRKKRGKEAKKNTQWKSKQKKDPGIPNNFPYKDQILAEVAEERRQAAEAKQLRKQQKKQAKAKAAAGVEEASDDEGSEVAFDGIAALLGAKQAASSSKTKAGPSTEDAEDEEAATFLGDDFPDLKAVLGAADVVVEVLDARDPLAYHSTHLEEIVKESGKKLLLVLSKIDGCPREAVSSWATHFRAQHPTVLFRASSAFMPATEPSPAKGKGKERADDALGASSVIAALEKFASEKSADEPLVVAVVGSTNSGKSSFINSLSRKQVLPVYKLSSSNDGPTTTIFPQEVSIEAGGKKIRLIDTPGLSWAALDEQSAEDVAHTRARDILTRNKGRIDRLKDPEPVVYEIAQRASRDDVMLFYNLPAFTEKDSSALLSALARANGLVKKGGVLDLVGAARILLRDWSTGRFPRFTLPGPSDASTSENSEFASVYATDEKILSALPTRKERRKATGVVKLAPSPLEARKIALEVPWVGEDDSEGSDADEIEGVEGDESEDLEEDEEDEEDDEDVASDEEEEEVEEPVQPAGKRKRAVQSSALARPAKKVAFAPEPKNAKQARSAAGTKSKPAAQKPTKAATPAKSSIKSRPAAAPKVANSKKASAPSLAGKAANGEEAYDFKKFF